jgi:hypothetical protein
MKENVTTSGTTKSLILFLKNTTQKYTAKIWRDVHKKPFIEELFEVVKDWKQPKCLSKEGWLNKQYIVHSLNGNMTNLSGLPRTHGNITAVTGKPEQVSDSYNWGLCN